MKKSVKYAVIALIILACFGLMSAFVIKQFLPDLFDSITLPMGEDTLAGYARQFNCCETDSDCAWGQATICGCSMGGQMAPVNKTKVTELQNIRKRFVIGTPICPAMYTCGNYARELRCVEKKCI